MRIPAEAKVVGPHVRGAAVDQDEQGIAAGRVEPWRDGVEAVDALAAARREPEFPQRLPIDPGGAVGIELGERGRSARRGIDSDDLRGIRRALPDRIDPATGRATPLTKFNADRAARI